MCLCLFVCLRACACVRCALVICLQIAEKLSERCFHYNTPDDEHRGTLALCLTLKKLVSFIQAFSSVPPRFKQQVQDCVLRALVRREFDLDRLRFDDDDDDDDDGLGSLDNDRPGGGGRGHNHHDSYGDGGHGGGGAGGGGAGGSAADVAAKRMACVKDYRKILTDIFKQVW